MKIRPLIASYFSSVATIYKKGIATGITTFETKVPDWESWNQKYNECCRFVVEKNNIVVGWCALNKVSKRKVYKGVAEDTIYIDSVFQGKHWGRLLLRHLISESEREGFWTLQAAIFPQNKSSISLHISCGFRVIGVREKIAQRDGIWYDNILIERRSILI